MTVMATLCVLCLCFGIWLCRLARRVWTADGIEMDNEMSGALSFSIFLIGLLVLLMGIAFGGIALDLHDTPSNSAPASRSERVL